MAYLQDMVRTELNKSMTSGKLQAYNINLDNSRPSKNYLIGKSKYCNIAIPEGHKYTANYHAVVSIIPNFSTSGQESYVGDLKTKGRTVIERDDGDGGKMLHPVEYLELKPAVTADRIYRIKEKDLLTFGSENTGKYGNKYKIRYSGGKFLNSNLENALNEKIITHVIGTSDLASITVPDRIRNVEVKNVDLFHAAIISYEGANGQKKWGVVDLGTKGKTHIRRNGLIDDIKSSEDELEEDTPITKLNTYQYKIFKLEHGDEILLNGIEDKELTGAYAFKFLETIEGKK